MLSVTEASYQWLLFDAVQTCTQCWSHGTHVLAPDTVSDNIFSPMPRLLCSELICVKFYEFVSYNFYVCPEVVWHFWLIECHARVS